MTTTRNENTTPSFEILEPRVLLAGDVTATLAGSTLVIQGDAQSNAVIVYGTAAPGQFLVSGVTGSQTTVNGSGFSLFDGVTSMKINMGQGNDELLIGDPGTVVTTTIPGNLSINMGGGTKDGVYIGYDNTASDYLGNVDIGGSLTIQGSDAEDVVFLVGMSVTKNVTMKLGDSPTGKVNAITMSQNLTTATSNFIGGKLSITGGDGRDTWFIGNAEIMGSAQFKLGEMDLGQKDKITIDTSTIHGAVKITGGDGREDIDVLNSTLSNFSAQLKGSAGVFPDTVLFDSTLIVGKVKISANGACVMDILNNSGVYGSISIRSKGRAASNIWSSSVTGKVSVSGGPSAAVFLSQAASITGDVAVKGKERGVLSLDDASIIEGNVKLNGGSGKDEFTLASGCRITGSVKINFRTPEDGQEELVEIHGRIQGDLSVIGGNGREEIVIDGGIIDGNIKLDLKDAPATGPSSFNRLEITDSVLSGGVMSIRSKGEMSVAIADSFMYAIINMKFGKGDDQVGIINTGVFGSLILDTGDGNDTLLLGKLAIGGTFFRGSVTVKMGNGNDNVSIGDVFGLGPPGVTFQDECFFDGGSGLLDQFFALDPNYDNNFQLGVSYTNFEIVF